jgi:hypothetical protein
MNGTDIMIANAKSELLNMAKQAHALGIGLQNVAPGDKQGTSNNTVEYLLTISEKLTKIATACEALLPTITRDIQRKEL